MNSHQGGQNTYKVDRFGGCAKTEPQGRSTVFFRAQIDRFVLKLVNLKVVKAADFDETPRGFRLNREALRAFVLQFEKEVARAPRSGGLPLGRAIYAQCLSMREHMCSGRPLVLYRWD